MATSTESEMILLVSLVAGKVPNPGANVTDHKNAKVFAQALSEQCSWQMLNVDVFRFAAVSVTTLHLSEQGLSLVGVSSCQKNISEVHLPHVRGDKTNKKHQLDAT